MSSVNLDNPLSLMLDKAFSKIDSNHDNTLDAQEYKSFYEVLRAGIAVDKNEQPVISGQDYFQRMDHNGDGGVTRDEMQTTTVIMPADLCDTSLNAMIDWLKNQKTASALLAVQFLSAENPLTKASTQNS